MQSKADIKNRIKSIRETSQITKAMELVSVSKLRKANEKLAKNRYYYNMVRRVLKDVLAHSDETVKHPYLSEETEFRKTAFVVIASDKGLAGDYNMRVTKFALEEIRKAKEAYVFTIGHMAHEFFRANGIVPDVDYLYCAQDPVMDDARIITYDLVELFQAGIIDSVKVVYTKNVTASKHEPTVLKLLPLSKSDFTDVKDEESEDAKVVEFSPDPKTLFENLIPQYIVGMMMSAMIEATAIEHNERMRAMNSASENAAELISELEISYNRARQEAITTEIAEIASSGIFMRRD